MARKKTKPEDLVERTVVLVKPDGVRRGLVGEIVSRFEKVGLKVVAAKMIWVDATHAGKHYRDDDDYHRTVGEKTLENYEKYGLDPGEDLGTKDPIKIGKVVRERNMEFLSSGPVVAMILEGVEAISLVRKIVGHTFPSEAAPGTIRGDYGWQSAYYSNVRGYSAENLIHASGDKKEADLERKLWFKEKEIYNY